MKFLVCFFMLIFTLYLITKAMDYYKIKYDFAVHKAEYPFVCGFITLCGFLCFFSQKNVDKSIIFIILSILILISWLDWHSKKIPNRLNGILFVLGLLIFGRNLSANLWHMDFPSLLYLPGLSWKTQIMGFFILSLPMIFINKLYPGGFGGGDIKLLAALGLIMGWQHILYAMLIGSITAAGVCMFLLINKQANRKDTIAFGPYLCLGLSIILINYL